MGVSQTQQYTKAWIMADSQATVENFLALPEQLMAAAPSVGSLVNVSITLQGSTTGFQVQGDIASVRKDLANLDDKSFVTANLTGAMRDIGNAQLQISLHFAHRLISVTISNAVVSSARTIFDLLLQRFPESVGISHAELASKADRLAAFIKEAEALKTTTAELQVKSKEITELVDIAKKSATNANTNAVETDKQRKDIQTQQAQVQTARVEAEKKLGEITSVTTQVQGMQSAIQQQHQNITTMEAKVHEFFGQIDKYKKNLIEAENTTSTVIKKNTDLQTQVNELLIKAVGVGLFGAFDHRKSQLVIAKWIWAGLTLLTCVIQVGIVVWLATEAKDLGVAGDAAKLLSPLFLLKATAAIPVFFLIGFCVSQYSHERRFEETYAFKSALSFSLAPYLDLVKKMPEQATADKYRDFVVSTVGQVFANPFHDDKKKNDETHKMLGDVEHLMDSVGKFVEKVRR